MNLLQDFTDPMTSVPLGAAVLRLVTAMLLGGIIGWEREISARAAGLRTHMLISLAAAMFTIVAMELTHFPVEGDDTLRIDPLRLIEAVTAGVATLRICDPQFTADQVNFEVISAFATTGLSTGITADLSTPSQLALCLLMYLGRIGPFTLVAALALRTVSRRFDYPTERPFIG